MSYCLYIGLLLHSEQTFVHIVLTFSHLDFDPKEYAEDFVDRLNEADVQQGEMGIGNRHQDWVMLTYGTTTCQPHIVDVRGINNISRVY